MQQAKNSRLKKEKRIVKKKSIIAAALALLVSIPLHAECVILLHGLARSDLSFLKMESLLKKVKKKLYLHFH